MFVGISSSYFCCGSAVLAEESHEGGALMGPVLNSHYLCFQVISMMGDVSSSTADSAVEAKRMRSMRTARGKAFFSIRRNHLAVRQHTDM